ncbi:unnamed protein product [Protopolystoma xenopodis]|uniref:Uncharacterized protein n=1 Tax=Protopolystoma xenopodis TaxID=117903 RepID=A0A448XLI3_9PLAT|nr:unnamed protein product [Protopolystoma xenopodis]
MPHLTKHSLLPMLSCQQTRMCLLSGACCQLPGRLVCCRVESDRTGSLEEAVVHLRIASPLRNRIRKMSTTLSFWYQRAWLWGFCLSLSLALCTLSVHACVFSSSSKTSDRVASSH